MNYNGFTITWNETLAGVTVEAPCTGANLNGQICTHAHTHARTHTHTHAYV